MREETYAFVDTKDGTDVDTGVNVGRTVERVKHDAVATAVTGVDDDRVLVLFRDEDGALAGSAERVDHDVVREDVELLLVLALDVGGTGDTDPA